MHGKGRRLAGAEAGGSVVAADESSTEGGRGADCEIEKFRRGKTEKHFRNAKNKGLGFCYGRGKAMNHQYDQLK